MVYRVIHHEVKIAAIQLFECQLIPLNDILLCCGLSRRTFYRILKLWWETGDVTKQVVIHSRYQTLHETDIHYLLQLIRQNPDYILDELLCMLKTNRFISVHYTTIHNELICVGVESAENACNASLSNGMRLCMQSSLLTWSNFIPTSWVLLMRFPKTIIWFGDVMGGPKGGLKLANLNHLCVDGAHLLLESFLLMDLWQVMQLRVH